MVPLQSICQKAKYFLEKIKMTMEDNNHFKISLPLPTGPRLFFFRGDQNVKNFIEELQTEDPSLSNVSLQIDNVKISSSSLLDRVFKNPFSLQFNGKTLEIIPVTSYIPLSPIIEEETEHPSVERLKKEIQPLLQEKVKLDTKAARYANGVIYGGFGFLIAEWCFLARLTWWEFNWDIMEPVTYFITFGTAVLGYAYFALHKRDYTFMDLRESILVNRMFKNYTKSNFNIDRYFSLEYKLNQVDPIAVETMTHSLLEPHHEPQVVAKVEEKKKKLYI